MAVQGKDPAEAAGKAGAAVSAAILADPLNIGKFDCAENGGGCTLPYFHVQRTNNRFKVTITLTVFVAKWTGYASAGAYERSTWDKFDYDTRTHEEVHVRIFKLYGAFIGKTTSARTASEFLQSGRYTEAKTKVQVINDAFDELDMAIRNSGIPGTHELFVRPAQKK